MNQTLKDRIVGEISSFFLPAISEWKKFFSAHPLASRTAPEEGKQALTDYEQMLSSGKHYRPFLFSLGHRLGPNPLPDSELFLASGSVEALHNAFLIHDDIVDNSDLRRGKPTFHRELARRADEAHYPVNTAEYGRGMALNIGDLGQALAQDFILAIGASSTLQIAAIRLLNRHLQNTVIGQILDLKWTSLEDLTETEVLQIQTYKTAYYTFVMPLTMGATLAGADTELLQVLEQYGRAAGIAFQIQDDWLGMFGTVEEVGKPVDSDVKEGKKTLLMVYAYSNATPEEREFMKSVHGNANVSEADFQALKNLITKTGAKMRSDDLGKECVSRALQAIGVLETKSNAPIINNLRDIANYTIERKN